MRRVYQGSQGASQGAGPGGGGSGGSYDNGGGGGGGRNPMVVAAERRRKVGRCRMTVSKPVLKARMVSALEGIM
jgi:hypothetical protein